jgi:hypothetical protein
MKYVSKINIFGQKMMVKSGQEKLFWNSSMRKSIFLIHKYAQNCKFSNKNDLLSALRDFNKTKYFKWNFLATNFTHIPFLERKWSMNQGRIKC